MNLWYNTFSLFYGENIFLEVSEDEEKEDCGQWAIGVPVVCEFGEYGSQSRNNINYSFCIKLVWFQGCSTLLSICNAFWREKFTKAFRQYLQIIAGPAGNYADFSVLSKIVLIFDMLLGGLEIFPLIFNVCTCNMEQIMTLYWHFYMYYIIHQG